MLPIFRDGGVGQAYRLTHTYNGLSLNAGADSPTNTYRIDSCRPTSQYDSVTDLRPFGDGMETYTAYKSNARKNISGFVTSTSYAALFDKIKALAAAFDPALVSHQNPSTYGFIAYDFSVPTADTTNYTTGLVPSRYYARAMDQVHFGITDAEGLSVPFSIDLFLKDPRRYAQSTSARTGAGTLTNLGDYHSYPTLTITASGAGSATYQWKNTTTLQGAITLTLDLSGLVNTDVVSVDCETRSITKNGTSAPQLYVSGVWASMTTEPGTNTIAITNGTNMTTITTYRAAFAL